MFADLSPIHHVLVLDDDDVMRDLLGALLGLQGYDVLSASSGAQALALLVEHPVDLVLTDLQMPGLEGAALVGALRGAMSAATPLVGMSGARPAPDVRSLLDAFLSKPFDTGQLLTAMDAALAQRAAISGNAAGNAAGDTAGDAALDVVENGQTRPATAPARKAVLDEAIFASLAKMVPLPQLNELYKLTLSDVAKRHGRIVADAESGNLPAVQREAHAIKGGCGMVGAVELAELAAAIEGGTTANTSAIAEIPSACVRLRRMLDEKLQTA